MKNQLIGRFSLNIVIRQSNLDDLDRYTTMMQQTYEDTYVDDSIGLTAERFSLEIFTNDVTQSYLKAKLINDEKQKAWVACDGEDIVGAVTIQSKDDGTCEMSGFYVLPPYQGNGIGTLLWSRVLEFTSGRQITLDTYTHNSKTIQLYKHWGFQEDLSKPRFYRHWSSWPKGLEAEAMYMQRPAIIYKTALAVFKDKKILMVRPLKNKDVFYTLGG